MIISTFNIQNDSRVYNKQKSREIYNYIKIGIMNSGSFFRLDLETSKVVEGITYFDYIDLPDLNKGEDIISAPFSCVIRLSPRNRLCLDLLDERQLVLLVS